VFAKISIKHIVRQVTKRMATSRMQWTSLKHPFDRDGSGIWVTAPKAGAFPSPITILEHKHWGSRGPLTGALNAHGLPRGSPSQAKTPARWAGALGGVCSDLSVWIFGRCSRCLSFRNLHFGRWWFFGLLFAGLLLLLLFLDPKEIKERALNALGLRFSFDGRAAIPTFFGP
jgi:hypothetical protein